MSAADANALRPNPAAPDPDFLPTLFGAGQGLYPRKPQTFFLSMALHVLAVSLILLSGYFVVEKQEEIRQIATGLVLDPGEYLLPVGKKSGGGGGGGARDLLEASKGKTPKSKMEQIVPPTTQIRNEAPKLTEEMAIAVPFQLPSALVNVGDPLSKVTLASDGTGSGSGIGNSAGGGIGAGRGRGLGPGDTAGTGGGAFRVGGGVSAPRPLFMPDPEYSEEARKAKYQGTVVLWVVVGPDGRVHDLKVQRSLGLGLDEKALEAVKLWKFEPARMDGKPVAVQVNIEVNFRLY